ncbi:MAG TPA: TonB-dependent receptor [Noviherbaspirillum sp.]|jgi:iron complex outermembrane receptor protein|uniref:TonB-dependent receptor n=1 Tax=Noviherbaspirillum sp. TaxID=1926288 RepID=UPI002F94078B
MRTPDLHRTAIAAAVLFLCTGFHGAVQAQSAAGAAGGNETVLQTVTVNASADASAEGLPAPYAGGQVARGGRLGILGNVDVMSTPFSSTAYTQALIQNQQARSVADVLLNDPTVRVARGFGNYQELYVIRGFPVQSDDMAYNGLYGLLPRQFVATELLERVEVLRGANTFVNGAAPGNGGIGGAINLVPKRAPEEALTQATAGLESGGQRYLAADIARRFGPDQRSGIRLNVARRDGGTAIDDEERELNLLSVGLDHRGSNFRLSADLGYQQHKLDRARPSVDIGPGFDVPRAPDASSNYAQPWSYSYERDVFGTLRGEIDLSQDVTAWAAAGMRRGVEDNALANPRIVGSGGATSTYRFDNARRDNIRTGEAGIRAKLKTGAVGHTLVASVSAFDGRERNAYALSDMAGFPSSLYAPVEVAAPPATALVGGSLRDPNLTNRNRLTSIAIADTLSFAQDSVLLTLGARHQKIRQTSYDFNTGLSTASYNKGSVTPVAGLVVRPAENLSVYANYAEALSRAPTPPATAVNPGEIFSPARSKQKEIGIKYDAGSFGAGLALFTTSQPQGLVDAANRFSVGGEQRNRGAEMTVYGTPARGVRVLGGLTFLDAEQKRTGTANDGRDVIGAPEYQANLGAEWDIPGVRGLTLSGRVLHTAAQYADAANTQKLPSWTRFDAGLRYVTTVGNQLVTLRGQIENLADRDYWASAGGYPGAGYLVLGAPRTFVVSASVDF